MNVIKSDRYRSQNQPNKEWLREHFLNDALQVMNNTKYKY
jgi:hypothetical protein